MRSWLDLLPALPWLAPFAVIPRLANQRPNLSDSPSASEGLVSVIIPARNESAVIETVVTSVLASGYQPIEVLVVDDRSTDDTGLGSPRWRRATLAFGSSSEASCRRGGTASHGRACRDIGRRAVRCCCSPTPIPGTRPSSSAER